MPTAAVIVRNATATNTIQSTPAKETEPDVVSRTTTVRMTSPIYVVGDRRTENGARLHHRERFEVTEDTGGDADARRGRARHLRRAPPPPDIPTISPNTDPPTNGTATPTIAAPS